MYIFIFYTSINVLNNIITYINVMVVIAPTFIILSYIINYYYYNNSYIMLPIII